MNTPSVNFSFPQPGYSMPVALQTERRCPECRCDPAVCLADDTGEHCLTAGCNACMEGCPMDDCPVCGPSVDDGGGR